MERSVWQQVRCALSAGLNAALGTHVAPEEIRIPARDAGYAAAGCSAALRYGADAALWTEQLQSDLSVFSPVCGVSPVARVSAGGGNWLLFTLADAFYTAAMREILRALPPVTIPPETADYLLCRLRMLARKPCDTCPADPAVQRALWLCMGLPGEDRSRRDAETALLALARHLPPKERPALLARCGGAAEAAARLLYSD